jgi:thymidylate synthase (FAD)
VADLGFEHREARLQDVKNRQNSIEILQTDGDHGAELVAWWDAKQKFVTQVVEDVYTEAIQRGIAKEQARAVLPEGITTSRLYMQGTLRSWLHYIELRSGPETQKEHREIALACVAALEAIFPMVNEFLVK